MDLHRRRSVLVRVSEDGRRLDTARITNSPGALQAEIAKAGTNPRVVLEATYGWYWAADTLAEAWIAPGEVRELREITRYRQKLAGLRTICKDQVHAVLAKLGIPVTCSDLFGAWRTAWLDGLRLPQPYAGKVSSLRRLTGELDTEIRMLTEVTADLLAGYRGYRVIQELPGIGPVLAAVIVAEIGDVTRFRNPGQLASWAGLTPRHRESDVKVTRGHVTKQGSRQLRWALIEAVQRTPSGTRVRDAKDAIIARRGPRARNIAKVAAARQLLTLIFYGLRDGHIRCLSGPAGTA